MTKSLSILNKLTVDQFINLVYPVTELSFYFIVENGKIYLIEEGTVIETEEIINELAEEYINTSTDTSTTNADRIRTMTDEELAEFLLKLYMSYENPCSYVFGENCRNKKSCRDCFLEWIQSEVEGVTENE